jgi:hypothetical protein
MSHRICRKQCVTLDRYNLGWLDDTTASPLSARTDPPESGVARTIVDLSRRLARAPDDSRLAPD